MAREFRYKGRTINELRSMSMDDLVEILPSRIKRTLLRGLSDYQKKLMIRVRKNRKLVDDGKKPEIIRTHCRDMPILPEMVGLTFAIYNGKEFITVEIKPEMIGHYLGEYAMSRKPVKHSAPGIGATRSSLFVPIR